MKVLVVEDHDAQRKLARDVLAAAGHQVVSADAADPAIAAIAAIRPAFGDKFFPTETRAAIAAATGPGPDSGTIHEHSDSG